MVETIRRSAKRRSTERPRIRRPFLLRLVPKLTPAQRLAVRRISSLVTLGVLLIALAAWAPMRLDVSPGPHPSELQGVYLSQPLERDFGPPNVFVVRLEPHGKLNTEYVRFSARADTVATGVKRYSGEGAYWRVERSRGLAALVYPPRLCVRRGPKDQGTCLRMDWDASSGNIRLGGPMIINNPDRDLLARIRPIMTS